MKHDDGISAFTIVRHVHNARISLLFVWWPCNQACLCSLSVYHGGVGFTDRLLQELVQALHHGSKIVSPFAVSWTGNSECVSCWMQVPEVPWCWHMYLLSLQGSWLSGRWFWWVISANCQENILAWTVLEPRFFFKALIRKCALVYSHSCCKRCLPPRLPEACSSWWAANLVQVCLYMLRILKNMSSEWCLLLVPLNLSWQQPHAVFICWCWNPVNVFTCLMFVYWYYCPSRCVMFERWSL